MNEFDTTAYILGFTKGESEGERYVNIEGDISCVDDGDGNITISEG